MLSWQGTSSSSTQQSSILSKDTRFELVIISVLLLAGLALKSIRRGMSYLVIDFS